MKLKLLGIVIVACLVITAPVLADWEPNDPVAPTNHKMHYPQMPDPCGWDVKAGPPVLNTAPVQSLKVLADDFLCTGSGPITDIHF